MFLPNHQWEFSLHLAHARLRAKCKLTSRVHAAGYRKMSQFVNILIFVMYQVS